jgi:hypothetical protein
MRWVVLRLLLRGVCGGEGVGRRSERVLRVNVRGRGRDVLLLLLRMVVGLRRLLVGLALL